MWFVHIDRQVIAENRQPGAVPKPPICYHEGMDREGERKCFSLDLPPGSRIRYSPHTPIVGEANLVIECPEAPKEGWGG